MQRTAHLDDLAKAFAIAHKLANHEDTPQPYRHYCRSIAHLIWKSCGDAGFLNPYETLPLNAIATAKVEEAR